MRSVNGGVSKASKGVTLELTELKMADTRYGADEKSDIAEPVEPIAEKLGLKVVVADDKTIQLDLDGDQEYTEFLVLLNVLRGHLAREDMYCQWTITTSKSGRYHAYLRVTKDGQYQGFGLWTRIALQAALGSDRKRELMNAIREMQGVSTRDNVVLFETPGEFDRVQEFLK